MTATLAAPIGTKQEVGNNLWVEYVLIADLREQTVNAHVMSQAMMTRLMENIRKEGHLESLPFCAQPDPEKPIEIVSGHHRVRAAVAAGMVAIWVLVDRNPRTRSQIVAKQLAHNALSGTDDAEILRRLVAQIKSVDDLLETGLPENFLPTPDAHKAALFAPHANYRWKTVTLVFLEHQMVSFEGLVKAMEKKPDLICAACENQFVPFTRAVADFAKERGILSAAVAIATLTEKAIEEAAELKEANEKAQETKDRKGWTLLSEVLGSTRIPPDAAHVIKSAIALMVEREEMTSRERWRALELWAADYLAGA